MVDTNPARPEHGAAACRISPVGQDARNSPDLPITQTRITIRFPLPLPDMRPCFIHRLRLATLAVASLVLLLSANAVEFTSVDIADKPLKPGSTVISDSGDAMEIAGYGVMFGIHRGRDEGRFVYTKLNGDFDLSAQVTNVASSVNAFAEGGFMVRKSLDPADLFVAQFVTSNGFQFEMDQYTFMFRMQHQGNLEPYDEKAKQGFWGPHTIGDPSFGYSARGWAPKDVPNRPFPKVWLRLKREGNTYTGYRKSGDGDWEKMASIEVDLGEEPLVGFALSANHHHATVFGTSGDRDDKSTLYLRAITGFPKD